MSLLFSSQLQLSAPDAPTLAELISQLEPTPLQSGDREPAVALLQTILSQLQLYSGAISGYYDPATMQAVQDLQAQLGLTCSGQFDKATWYGLTFWQAELAPDRADAYTVSTLWEALRSAIASLMPQGWKAHFPHPRH